MNNKKDIVPLWTTSELMEYLHCGRKFAIKIGKQANAQVVLSPKKHFWDREKIIAYKNAMQE